MTMSFLLEILPICRRLCRPESRRYKRGRQVSRQREARPYLAEWPNSAAFHREITVRPARRGGESTQKKLKHSTIESSPSNWRKSQLSILCA
jgi:hypothetical protein